VAFKTKERATGFGPAMSAWKADALPLGDARNVLHYTIFSTRFIANQSNM
jgi:hypothetical protein